MWMKWLFVAILLRRCYITINSGKAWQVLIHSFYTLGDDADDDDDDDDDDDSDDGGL